LRLTFVAQAADVGCNRHQQTIDHRLYYTRGVQEVMRSDVLRLKFSDNLSVKCKYVILC